MAAKKLLYIMGIGLAAVIASTPAQATTIATDLTDTDTVPGIATYMTTGDLMAGMEVSVVFGDSHMETLSWTSMGGTSGGVVGDGWSLSVAGNTFTTDWVFTNNRIDSVGRGVPLTSLTLDGRPGLTLFDRTFNDLFGTPGSFRGLDFAETPTVPGEATYRRQVGVGINAPVGDLWHVLDIAFTQGIGSFTFVQDTDNDIRRPPPPGVPEPGTSLLLGLGLTAMALFRRRRGD